MVIDQDPGQHRGIISPAHHTGPTLLNVEEAGGTYLPTVSSVSSPSMSCTVDHRTSRRGEGEIQVGRY
jgi:hypothetical protein